MINNYMYTIYGLLPSMSDPEFSDVTRLHPVVMATLYKYMVAIKILNVTLMCIISSVDEGKVTSMNSGIAWFYHFIEAGYQLVIHMYHIGEWSVLVIYYFGMTIMLTTSEEPSHSDLLLKAPMNP